MEAFLAVYQQYKSEKSMMMEEKKSEKDEEDDSDLDSDEPVIKEMDVNNFGLEVVAEEEDDGLI